MAAEDRFTHHPIVVTDDKWMHHYFDNPYKAAKATGLSYELIREIVFDHKKHPLRYYDMKHRTSSVYVPSDKMYDLDPEDPDLQNSEFIIVQLDTRAFRRTLEEARKRALSGEQDYTDWQDSEINWAADSELEDQDLEDKEWMRTIHIPEYKRKPDIS